MTPRDAALYWLSTFATVFLLGFQSRMVNSGRYLAAACSSLLIGAGQQVVIRTVAAADPIATLLLGCTAGPLAIVSAMAAARRFNRRRPPGDPYAP